MEIKFIIWMLITSATSQSAANPIRPLINVAVPSGIVVTKSIYNKFGINCDLQVLDISGWSINYIYPYVGINI